MKTPITDANRLEIYTDPYTEVPLRDGDFVRFEIAARLEIDRAALKRATEEFLAEMGAFRSDLGVAFSMKKANAALVAARANFPEVSPAVCCQCKNEPQLEPHSCPFLSDVKDDEETLCTCCARCTHECAQDI